MMLMAMVMPLRLGIVQDLPPHLLLTAKDETSLQQARARSASLGVEFKMARGAQHATWHVGAQACELARNLIEMVREDCNAKKAQLGLLQARAARIVMEQGKGHRVTRLRVGLAPMGVSAARQPNLRGLRARVATSISR